MLWFNSKNGLQVVKLREWRERNARTQQNVADAINELARDDGADDQATITQGSIDRWEKGTIPRQENIRRVSRLTGDAVSFADFYAGEAPPKRTPRARTVSIAASRKAAATVRRQQASR